MSMLGTRRLPTPDGAIQVPGPGRRFALSLPCSCMSPAPGFARLAGRTCDMSRSGVLARFTKPGASEVLPQVGETALLEIDLPTSANFSPRFMRCTAVVVRVVAVETDQLAVAFALRRIRVEERHQKASCDTGVDLQTPPGPGGVQ
jgi:hypothetical protein